MINIFDNNDFATSLNDAQPGPVIVTLDDIKSTTTYSADEYFLFSTHLGQRKLYLAAVQYLTEVGATNEVCVYAGSAPNFYAWDLHNLFPNVKFVYFDSNPHRFALTAGSASSLEKPVVHLDTSMSPDKMWDFIYKTSAIFFIYQGYFTHDICRAFTGKDVLFMSDIRTSTGESGRSSTYRAGKPAPTEEDIYANLTQQALWAHIMQPKSASFKFRTPFFSVDKDKVPKDFLAEVNLATSLGIDILTSPNSKDIAYFDGDMCIQAYPGELSTESRLIVRDFKSKKIYDSNKYEQSYYYYNTVSRLFVSHDNPFSGVVVGYDHSNDCALETYIWQSYSKKIRPSNIIDHIRSFDFGNRGIFGAGTLFTDKMSKSHYDYLYKKYADDYVRHRTGDKT